MVKLESNTNTLTMQLPFWIWNKAGWASKLPRWRMIAAVYLSLIMTNGTIVVKIYLTLIFWVICRNKSICHLYNTHKYIVNDCPALFQFQHGSCMIRLYDWFLPWADLLFYDIFRGRTRTFKKNNNTLHDKIWESKSVRDKSFTNKVSYSVALFFDRGSYHFF